jgi:hypothetical protein
MKMQIGDRVLTKGYICIRTIRLALNLKDPGR